MLKEELVKFVKDIQLIKTEDGSVEIKSAHNGMPKIYDTLSAFSNKDGGGTILFGIDEKDFSLCGVYNPVELQKKIAEYCLQMEPPVRAICTVVEIDNKAVVSAEIPEIEITKRPCYYKGAGIVKGSYVRIGSGDYKMSEYEVYSYESYRKKIQDELRVTDRSNLSDIKTTLLDNFLTRLSVVKPNLFALPFERKLSLQGFLVDEKPTLASTMLFCDYPQGFYPRLCVTAVVVDGETMGDLSDKGERFIDNQTIDGTISQMLSGAMNFIRRNSKNSTVIDPQTGQRIDKPEYPITAIREIILNALIHRDYSIHTDSTPITIVMYKNRIEIENPGGLYGRLTLDTLGKVSADARNPFLANAMEVLQETENRFSGIPTIRKEMQNAQLCPPAFESARGVFKVTLFNSIQRIDQKSFSGLRDEILDYCKTVRTRQDLSQEFSSLSKTYLFTDYVNPLVKEGSLKLGNPENPKSKYQTYVGVQ